MAAPTHTARAIPVGFRMPDGFSTKIAFALNPDVSFWERTVKPPGIDGGDKIESTTMHNVAWRTFNARRLKTLTDSAVQAAWDPRLYDDILSLVNEEGMLTTHFEQGDRLSFYGYLKGFEPEAFEEGKFPMAAINIVCTNMDPATGTEEAPVYVAYAGTDMP